MLIRFNVKNFLSFLAREDGQSQEFSMIAGNTGGKEKHIYSDNRLELLKFAAIFGANASGKSNLIKALNFMKKTVLYGLPKGHSEKYCKLNTDNKNKESYFEIEICIGGRYFAYGFEVILNRSKFVTEWLVELFDQGEDKIIFERDIAQNRFTLGEEFSDTKLIEKINIYADDVIDDGSVLFLNIMNKNKKNLYQQHPQAKCLKDVFEWVSQSLDINYPNRPILDYSYLADAKSIEKVCRTISAFGTGITDFELVEVPIERVVGALPKKVVETYTAVLESKARELKADNTGRVKNGFIMRSNKDFFIVEIDRDEKISCKTIQFSHGDTTALFELSEESDGTVRMLDLIEVLIAENKNKTYVIDELDRCLHPSMTYKFVDEFLRLCAGRNIQLIVTTHESRLLDFDLLRRDEIWFVNKGKQGETDIYSLEEYNARFDQKIDKAYLEGRYGGVPIFSTVFPVEGQDDERD